MQLLDRHRLGHIIEYCKRIRATITRFGNSYEAFSADEDDQQSIAFSILQIGELVAGLSENYKGKHERRNALAGHQGDAKHRGAWIWEYRTGCRLARGVRRYSWFASVL